MTLLNFEPTYPIYRRFVKKVSFRFLIHGVLTKAPRLDTGCIAQISILIYSDTNRIQKVGSCVRHLETTSGHCTQGKWYESIFKTGQYSQYPAGKPFTKIWLHVYQVSLKVSYILQNANRKVWMLMMHAKTPTVRRINTVMKGSVIVTLDTKIKVQAERRDPPVLHARVRVFSITNNYLYLHGYQYQIRFKMLLAASINNGNCKTFIDLPYCGAINFHQVLKIASCATPLTVAILCISFLGDGYTTLAIFSTSNHA